MIPAPFEYVEATNIDHAVRLLAEHGDAAKLLAGGHTLIPAMRLRLTAPELLIDIGRVAEMRGISQDIHGIRIGAATTHAEIADAPDIAKHFPIMVEAASVLADPLVRNKGTIGGSIANADPAADWTAVMLALDAQLEIRGISGERKVPVDRFFTGLFDTDLQPGEVLTAIIVPFLPSGAKSTYIKIRHPASGYAIVGVACVWRKEADVCETLRLGITGVGKKPYRAVHLEEKLKGQPFDAGVVERYAHLVTHDVEIGDDPFSTAEYKRNIARVVVGRALARVNPSIQ